MKDRLVGLVLLFVAIWGASGGEVPGQEPLPPPVPKRIAIRLLVLRHSPDQMAVSDSNLAQEAARKAQAEGLDISVLGDEYIAGWSSEKLQEYVAQKSVENAVPGDTLVIHTIGHGHGDGSLDNLGQRRGVMGAFAAAGEQASQKILWWQLSCHACAGLPEISTLPESQQSWLVNLASSTAHDMSADRVQAGIMEKVFGAMAKKDPAIDHDQDDYITVSELGTYLDTLDSYQRSRLLFARRTDVFGGAGATVLAKGPPRRVR